MAHMTSRAFSSRGLRLAMAGAGFLAAIAISTAAVLVAVSPVHAPPKTGDATRVPTVAVQSLTLSPIASAAPTSPPGAGWSPIGPGFAQAAAFSPAMPATIFACGTLNRPTIALGLSHDGGKTWQAYATGIAGQGCAMSVSPTQAGDVALAIHQCQGACGALPPAALFVSPDSGAHWKQALLPSGSFGMVLGWLGQTLFATTNDPAAPLAVGTLNGGFTLQADLARFGGAITTLAPAGATMYATVQPAGATDPFLAASADGGVIWQGVSFQDGAFPVMLARPAGDGKTLIGLEHEDTLAFSTDNGQTWQTQQPFPNAETLASPLFAALAPDGTLVARTRLASGTDAQATISVLAPGGSWGQLTSASPDLTLLQMLTWDAHGHPAILWGAASLGARLAGYGA